MNEVHLPLCLHSGLPAALSTAASRPDAKDDAKLPPPASFVGGRGRATWPETVCLGRGVVLHDEAAEFVIEDHVVLGSGVVLRPPVRTFLNRPTAQVAGAVHIGAFTVFARDCVSEAASVGRFVRVEQGCVIGAGAVLPDGVWLRAGSVVLGDAVLRPFTLYEGCPAVAVARLGGDDYRLAQMEYTRQAAEQHRAVE